MSQQHLDIRTFFEFGAGCQFGSRENLAGHRPGDGFRLGAIINHGLGCAEIPVIADLGHREPENEWRLHQFDDS
ncbi:MAG: hypothetical protein LAN59_16475, partial [Acidobacteriia bacterium]|nr:hypothetical protein [Terriglobia bacterium]